MSAMSTGDALQVTTAGLFSQNIYRRYIRPNADEAHYVHVTRIAGIVIIAAALGFAIAMRHSVVESILNYFKLTAAVGVSVAMGVLWRRMNSVGSSSDIGRDLLVGRGGQPRCEAAGRSGITLP